MAQLVRAEHDLPSLRIAYRDGGRVAVCFWLVRGGAEPELVAQCPVAELGPVDFPDEVTVTDDQFSLPSDVMYELSRRMSDLGMSDSPPDNAIWLELVSPRGYLHLIPWEQLLQPLGRPLVRLPNYTVRPQAQSPTIEVALCASSTVLGGEFDPAATLARLARLWLTMSGKRTRVHLFCDGWAHEQVAELVEGMDGVKLADPARWEEVAYPSSMVSNPWLEWIGGALEGLALDVVHLVGYGYLSGGRGAVALAATPTSRAGEHAEFVGAAQLAQFVAARGAWTFLVSGPPDNYSGAGLRDVADTLAINSPGISIAHDLMQDPDVGQLTRVVELVFAGKESVTEPLPGICAWAHPKFVEYPEENLITRTGHSAMVGEATREVLDAPDTPASVASGTRYLESLQAQWSASQGGAIDAEAVAALRRVSDVLERRSVELRDES
ncbi:hypothetical protein MWU75_13565 [Ornithinimicrobium sp. F0845]|uniref:hypothetical protein n=1 Tax=Ornithinimicrobium sp. F0845 TaxID=2926412 RepID=UPI001FF54C75|nr:hypothetical protein [Ornithinimicrobium sp. F0845]MCK0113171.1 hypothetical protein [Ornithinimicrobium sp. F0845]